MKNVLRNFTLAGFGCLVVSVAAAQSSGASSKDKMGEYDEIVIKNKSSKGGKVTVEIKDGDILVDGNKLDRYNNPDISVFRRKITPMNGNNFSFGGPSRGEIQLFNSDGDDEGEEMPVSGNKAVLGVITEKTTAVGATVKSVAPGSPAEKAGLKTGDAITKINNETINEPKELFETIGRFKPGDKITVSYTRNNKQNKVTVTLDERKEDAFGGIFNVPRRRGEMFTFPMPRGGQGFGGFERADDGVKLGIQVQDTDEGDAAQVINMTPGSPAEKAGFKVNDLITEMAGSPVKSAHDVAEIYRSNRNKGTITTTIKRNGQTQTIDIKIPKKLHTADL